MKGVRSIPLMGRQIAAGIDWQATLMLGEQLVNEAESLAKEIRDDIFDGSEDARRALKSACGPRASAPNNRQHRGNDG